MSTSNLGKTLAKYYGVCPRTISDWMARRRIPYLKLSHKVLRFNPDECEAAFQKFKRNLPREAGF